jgi:hypothetical protein
MNKILSCINPRYIHRIQYKDTVTLNMAHDIGSLKEIVKGGETNSSEIRIYTEHCNVPFTYSKRPKPLTAALRLDILHIDVDTGIVQVHREEWGRKK